MFFALSQRASSLCSTCRQFPRGRFLLNKNGSTGFHSYHPSLSSLQKSVDAGCHLCIGLTQSLEIFLQIHPQTKQAESWSIKCSLGAFTRSLQFLFVLCDCDCDYAYESDQPGRSSCEHALHLQEMNFSLARRLGLGPEFLGALIDQNDYLQLLELICLHQILRSRLAARSRQEASPWPDPGINNVWTIRLVGTGDKSRELFQPG